MNTLDDHSTDPVTLNDAMTSSDKDKWRSAMQKEIESLEENKVWDLVELPKDRQVTKPG